MKLEKAITPEQLKPVYELYIDAFPEIERKPISLIEEKVAEGSSEVFSIMDGDEFVGFAIYVIGRDLVLLDFFAILPEKRCGGYGSKVFPLLMSQYPGKHFLLEIEDPDGDVEEQEKELRRRRKAFYLRQGMVSMPFLIDLFGVEMEVLTDGCQLDFSEYHGLIRGVYGPIIDEKILFVRYLDDRKKTDKGRREVGN
ncbi:MAG: GNAT family N-acetyltransferase [Eubacterium sp.]|nr:GNAT family N-acetyltransferase [Eubacterium sp.]